MSTDIIIPAYNQVGHTKRCLSSVREYSTDYRVIFIDNGSDLAELDETVNELRNMPHTLVRNTRNLGFVKAINQGICLSTAPYIVFLNNDTKVTKNWLEKLQYPLEQELEIGATGPVTTTPHCWQGREEVKPGYRVLPKSAMIAFFCAMLRSEVVEKVGLLDESFGAGLADDDDYCHRIKKAGYTLALAQDLVITHYHRTTFQRLYNEKQIAEMTKAGISHFQQKHGLVGS